MQERNSGRRHLTPDPSAYRPDIDGLRAIAVLLVVLFHLNVKPFSGGFIGVDVFFVISGFLITRMIVDDLRSPAGFSFLRFYERRSRRILPALVFTAILCALGAFLLFPPEEFEHFGASLAATGASGANFFFYIKSGYFDAELDFKPLLHLWSLGVEEQFYMVWPIVLVLLMKQTARTTVLGITMMAALSLGLSQWFLGPRALPAITAALPQFSELLSDTTAAAFFMMPFRLVEFAIGALMVWVVQLRLPHPLVIEAIFLVGLSLICRAAMTYTRGTAFPGVNALLPCLGTALLIYAGTARYSGWLLRNPLARGLGLISYSLYLLHWPLIVFLKAYTLNEPTSLKKWMLIAISVACAVLMYYYIELPFRRGKASRWQPRKTFAVSGLAAFVVIVLGLTICCQAGWPWRVPPERLTLSTAVMKKKEDALCRRRDPNLPAALVTCQNNRGKGRRIFLWGDSHARHLIGGFTEVYKDYDILVLYRGACIAQSGFAGYTSTTGLTRQYREKCVAKNREVLEFLLGQPPATVIITGAKRDDPVQVAKASAFLLARLREAGHNAVLLGDFIRPGKSIGTCRNVPAWIFSDQALTERCAPDKGQVEHELKYSGELLAALPEMVDVRPIQCPDGRCRFTTDDGHVLFRDSHHLSTYGSEWLVERLRDRLPIHSGSADPDDVTVIRPEGQATSQAEDF